MIDDRLILITLLVKLGVSAAVSSVLARSRRFRVLLYHEGRTIPEQLEMALLIALPFALGVVVRHTVKNFLAADLTFEASILMGVLCGRLAGTAGGLMVSIPYLFTHNWVNVPVNVVAGLAAGMLGNLAKDREAIWSFSPLLDLSVYRWIRRTVAKSFIDWQTSFFVTVLTLEFFKQEIEGVMPENTFVLDSPHLPVNIAIYLTTVGCVAVSIKVLNNTRIEMKLEERDRLLLNARMEALQNQINPHFLFNTLNSVSSLVRFDPDAARTMVLKLANILRRLLRKGDSFVELRDELEFIDDYLDIEVVRFGREKLKVVKELDPRSMEVMVPSLLLQPLVENAIKHGLSPKIEGGTIFLRSRLIDESLVVEVEDDGVGVGGGVSRTPTTGIGLANVRERLHVLYGDNASVEFESNPGKGTLVRLLLPIPQDDDYGMPNYESRPNTAR